MNDEEKKAFLKKMGYGGSALATVTGASEAEKKQKARIDNRVDRDDLLATGRIFGVLPKVEKTPSFEEYLQQQEGKDEI